jgi:hypothetical protein
MTIGSRNAAFAIGLSVLVATARVDGHHHIGCVYDTGAPPQKVTGRIVEIVWKFPHVHIRLDATTGSPGTVWDIETVNPQGLRRVGVESDTLEVGQVLITTSWIAKDGGREAFTQSMTLPKGNTVAFPIADLTCPF